MGRPVERIVILGGGTAGWLAAGLIAARLGAADPATAARVTLVEAPGIAPIGVGEGTWPTMRATLAAMGIAEADFLVACDAAFKQGSRFDGWRDGAAEDCYHHPFTPPPPATPAALVGGWAALAGDRPFAEAVCAQPAVCRAGLAPRQPAMPDGAGALNYGYHLDAGKLGSFLADHARDKLGVRHLHGEVVEVERDGADGIAALRTSDGQRIEGDLFIDCSGQRARLIGEALGVGFEGCEATLFNDRALAVQLPVAPDSAIASQTIGTAHRAGWLWDIGLPTRRGIGCVYSSAFLSQAEAEAELGAYLARAAPGARLESLSPRALSFAPGHRSEFWRGNVLAVGLSAGFVEPLEASAIVLIELSLQALLDNFPASRAAMPIHARRFNTLFRQRWERIVEFLKLHYVPSRRDEPYWRAHREAATIPPRLAELVRLWHDQPPSAYDLPLADEMFPAASYQYVWYGMGGARPGLPRPPSPAVASQLAEVAHRARQLASALPGHRAYLDRLAAQRLPARNERRS